MKEKSGESPSRGRTKKQKTQTPQTPQIVIIDEGDQCEEIANTLKSRLKLNLKCKIRDVRIREFLAELFGTFVLIAFGDASVAQTILNADETFAYGSFFSINWGWGIGVALGVLVAGGVSGAHLNPAVSVAMAVIGKLPWRKVAYYILAQYIGAFLGASCVFVAYVDAFDGFGKNNQTAGIFATYPQEYLTTGGGFVDQLIGTALLLFCVLAITDEKNMKVPSYLVPLYVGFTVLNIGICFGMNCGYAINPARDLGPRIFTAIAGWGSEPFTFGFSWWWVPIVATHIGAVIGVLLYTVVIENHWPDEDTSRQDPLNGIEENAGFELKKVPTSEQLANFEESNEDNDSKKKHRKKKKHHHRDKDKATSL